MESMFCVEQINVPPELGTIMKQYTKAVLRDRPHDLYKYSANFFAALCGQSAPFDKDGQYVDAPMQDPIEHFADTELDRAEAIEPTPSAEDEAQDVIRDIFNEYNVNGDGRLSRETVPALLEDLQRALWLDESETIGAEELLGILDVDENDTVDLLELRKLFFNSNDSS